MAKDETPGKPETPTITPEQKAGLKAYAEAWQAYQDADAAYLEATRVREQALHDYQEKWRAVRYRLALPEGVVYQIGAKTAIRAVGDYPDVVDLLDATPEPEPVPPSAPEDPRGRD